MATLTHIRKRTGQVVSFDAQKINRAVEKAFLAVLNEPHTSEADAVSKSVRERLEERMLSMSEQYVPSVEEVQDLVEMAIMERGFFNVAKAYIVYRYEHTKIRAKKQEEVREKIEKREFVVTNDDGTATLFPPEMIRGMFVRASRGFESVVNLDKLVEQTQRELFDGMTMRDVTNTLVLVARSFIERDQAYSFIASRLLLLGIVYADALGDVPEEDEAFTARYREAFAKNIRLAVAQGTLDERMLSFDLAKIATFIDPKRDELLKYLGTQTLFDRYFIKDKTNHKQHHFLETPQFMWMRVAMGLSLNEDNKEERAVSFYNLMSTLRYVPSTPTLFNAGTKFSQLSSCYLGVVADDLHSIFKSYEDYAHMARLSGGVAYSWTKLRGTGALVKSTGVTSNGVISFLKILDSTVVGINRSGRRRGACCVYLEPWHIDVEDFIELRKNTGDERRRTHDLNTALWIPDLFMKRVRDNGDWTLFSPDEVSDLPETYGQDFENRYSAYERKADDGLIRLFKRVKARDLWKKVLTQLYETGHPWITFKDAGNVRSPLDHVGVIHNSNLCTEIELPNEADKEVAVCNLGSINLGKHIVNGVLDEAMIRESATTAMRMLDNIIDLNYYPIPETRNANLRHRPVGLGVMGLQDALYKLNVPFDSEEAVSFSDKSLEMISYYAILASSLLASERGVFQSYQGSKWDRGLFPIDTLDLLERERGEALFVDRKTTMNWEPVRASVKKYGMRNSNCMALAPTATISNIAGCFPTIEPIYKNIYVKSNISGTFIVVNDYLIEDLKKEGLWNQEMLELLKGNEGDLSHISAIPQWIKNKYKEVFAIDQQWLIKAAASRAKWIDQSQSLNIFYSGTSGSELSNIYQYAWQTGLKTTYYLRSLGATAIEQSTITLDKQHNLEKREKEAIEAIAEIKEEIVTKEPVMVGQRTGELKLCKIDDPTCESCQ